MLTKDQWEKARLEMAYFKQRIADVACRAAHSAQSVLPACQCHSSSRSRRTASLAGFFDLSHVFDGPLR